jgi:hypothetical protein
MGRRARTEEPQPVAGLGPEVEVPKLTPALQGPDLSLGVVARYLGSEQRKSKGFDRPQQLHSFELGQRFGRVRFALWGSVQLDLKLRVVQPTSVVVVQYEGRDENVLRAPHKWSVRPFHGTSQDLQALQELFEEGGQRVVNAVRSIESRTEGADFTDDEIPF